MSIHTRHPASPLSGTLPVLIVGAGPTGLVLAIELARRGIGMRIIDQLDAPLYASRAKGIQPRTLEIFDDLGLVDDIISSGGTFPRWRAYEGDRLLWEKSIYDLLGRAEILPTVDRPYPQTWMIPQWRTEEVLRNRLADFSVGVEFGTTFHTLEQRSDGVVATIGTAEGEEHVRCRFLVGADGARSEVRKAVGISFPGETKDDESYIIADVRGETLDREHWLNWSFGGDPVRRVSMCPMPKSEYFQFVAPLVPGEPEPELSLSTIQRIFEERTGRTGTTLSDARWIVRHKPITRLADRFRDGAVFLSGDAAHSPPSSSPGQGMNISVQDAYNLGWKLAAVISGAPDNLLDSYEEERRPIAAGVLGVLAKELQATSVDALEAQVLEDQIRKDVFNLDHNYRGRNLSRETRASPGRVRAGDRAPDALTTTAEGELVRIFDLLRGPHATLLTFNFASSPSATLSQTDLAVDIDVHVIRAPLQSHDKTDAHSIYGVPPDVPTLMLIRPDGYIAMCVDDHFEVELENTLDSYFGRSAA